MRDWRSGASGVEPQHRRERQSQYQTMVNGESAFWSLLGQIELAESAREASAGTRPPPALSERLSLERQAGRLPPRDRPGHDPSRNGLVGVHGAVVR